MIQTLSPRISTGSILGQALGQGVQTGLQTGFEKAQMQRNQSLLNQALSQAQQIYADPNLTPEEKQIGLYQTLSARPEIAQSLGQQLQNLNKQTQGQQLLNRIFGSSPTQQRTPQQPTTSPQQMPQQQVSQQIPTSPEQQQINQPQIDNPQTWTDEQLGKLRAFANQPGDAGIIGKMAEDEFKRREEEKKTLKKEEIEFHKEHIKYDEKIREDAELAKKQLLATKDILKSIETGKIKPNSISSFFRGLGTVGDKIANAFLNAEQGKVEAAIPLLIEGWRQVFGTRISDADLRVIQSKLPDIGKSPEANKSIIDIIQKYANRSILKSQVAKDVKKKFKGKRPIDYPELVEEEFDKRIEQIEQKENLPVQRQKVAKGTSLTDEIVDKYLEISGNDPMKAAQMAREDGYEF